MDEDFLHYIWKYKLYNKSLLTYNNEAIEVLSVGEHNTDAGPDFFNSKITIGKTTFAGNVEIHKKSSDWFIHNHNIDKAYDNVILHIVYTNDKDICRTNGEKIPTIEIKFDKKLTENYLELKNNENNIKCKDKVADLPDYVKSFWVQKLFIERLEQKSNEIIDILESSKNNWEETFYVFLAKNFGFKLNALPFQLLAKSLPLKYLAKHKNNLQQIEALMFGVAGFLNETYEDEYFTSLKSEYVHLKNKFQLQGIEKHLWKFLRLRPSNFPTIRISQFSHLIYKSNGLFSKLIETENISQIKDYFDIQASEYWDNHYTFGTESKGKSKNFGKTSLNIIIINTIIPFLFVYGKIKGIEIYKERAIDFAEQVNAESNSIITEWETLNIVCKNAFDSQALIHLYNNYCKADKCLNCQFGNKIISDGINKM